MSAVTTANFPPKSWLGFSLDLTSPALKLSEIQSVTEAVLTAESLIAVGKTGTQQSLAGVTWTVPDDVNAAEDIGTGSIKSDTFNSGTDTAKALKGDANLSGRYLCISGSLAVNASLDRSFHENRQYMLFNYTQTMLNAKLHDYTSKINVNVLGARLAEIPAFDPTNISVRKQYSQLFRTLGSHVITGAIYGSRLELNASSLSSSQSDSEQFEVNVAVAFNGLTNGGSFNANVASTTEYATFHASMHSSLHCTGGNPVLAAQLMQAPQATTVNSTFISWMDSAQENPALIALETIPLWDLLTYVNDESISSRSEDVQNAFKWLIENSNTAYCTFTIDSDWAELSLPQASSAHILQDPNIPPPPGLGFLIGKNNKQLALGLSANNFITGTASFLIVNDGSPVLIETSHGGASTAGVNKGACTLTVNNTVYENYGGVMTSQGQFATGKSFECQVVANK